jgi:hypothetical protein
MISFYIRMYLCSCHYFSLKGMVKLNRFLLASVLLFIWVGGTTRESPNFHTDVYGELVGKIS